ncbi:MAG: helix-turn-helix domain-containing protein [Thiotrichales bacterium]|nr:helix-turn-helix domain-containing protein [Thiotrichales bacterium]
MNEIEIDTNDQPLNEKFILAREQKNLTLEEVADSLNLRMSQLNKLENELLDLENMTPFERGYVRNYAQFLEVDIHSYEEAFPESDSVGSELKSMSRYNYPAPLPFFKRGAVKFILVLIVVVILASLLLMNFDLNS